MELGFHRSVWSGSFDVLDGLFNKADDIYTLLFKITSDDLRVLASVHRQLKCSNYRNSNLTNRFSYFKNLLKLI